MTLAPEDGQVLDHHLLVARVHPQHLADRVTEAGGLSHLQDVLCLLHSPDHLLHPAAQLLPGDGALPGRGVL